MSDSARPWSVAHQGPLPTEFSRQEHWSELSFPSPGNLPDPGIEPGCPALQVDFYHLSHHIYVSCQITLSSVEVLIFYFQLSLVAQRLKHLPGMRETCVRSLVQEDPLEKEMATHSSTFAWRIPWREEPGRLQSMGLHRVGQDWATLLSLSRISLPSIKRIYIVSRLPWWSSG